jgi:hypothetical protein
MKRSAVATLALLAVALLVGGCGGGSSSSSHAETQKKATAPSAPAGSKVASCGGGAQLRATEVDCATARTTMESWENSDACALGTGSRSSCSLGAFRCQAVKVGQGTSVSCADPEGDVAFIVKSGG